MTLPADPRSVRQARDFVRSVLADWGMGRLGEEARLVTSELVTNGVLHGRTTVVLTVSRHDERAALRITVADGSDAQPRRTALNLMATAGRGLALVERTAQSFGVQAAGDGKEVWCELHGRPDART